MTRFGLLAVVAGLAAVVVGRVFGVVELYVIGAGFLAAVVAAAAFVLVRAPSVDGVRWIHPSMLVAGDTGRVDLELTNRSALRSTRFALRERIRRAGTADHLAELTVEPLAGRAAERAGYRLPTAARGVVELGPLETEVRDPLGLVRRTRTVAGVDRVVVAPRTHPLEMPRLGSGPLGRHLLAQARRLGPGEFHSLREYVDGDEPRTIHWKASARGESLLVRQHSVEGLRRMLVVLDADRASYADDASFERAVIVAASVVRSAHEASLVTRFVTGGVDLRGPDVSATTARTLAELQPGDDPLPVLDRDPGEGVGLLVVVSGRRASSGVRAARAVVDPTLATIPVTTDEPARGPVAAAARTEAELVSSWGRLVGGAARHRAARAGHAAAGTEMGVG